jgi:hypothetical protein
MSKASKKRECPAVGREISSGECGGNRISHYACPAECPYLPFAPANYSQLLDLEGKLDQESMDRLVEDAKDPWMMEEALQKARNHPNFHALHAFYVWNLFFARQADGLTCAERWERSAASGLKNDERTQLRAKMQTRVALLEIRQVVDHERLEAVDLLGDGATTLHLQDRGLAAVATRFSALLGWIYPLPHYWRLSGTAIVIPEMAQFDPREIATQIVSHLGGPGAEAETRLWLAENFVRFEEALTATGRMRRMQMLEGIDAKFGKAVYALQAPFSECRERLLELPDVATDSLSEPERNEGFADACVWFSTATDAGYGVPAGGRPISGRVLLGQSHWRLEAMGEKKLAVLRERFEAQLGSLVCFTGERVEDLGAVLAAKEPATDKSLVPPQLLENPTKIVMASSRLPSIPSGQTNDQVQAELLENDARRFLDDQIPALDNRTPREAARDAALRPRLILLVKQRIRQIDEQNLRTGESIDINWLPRELGLEELVIAPPPWRVPPPKYEDAPDERDVPRAPAAWLPPAPPLPAEPLSAEESIRRVNAGMDAFDSAADALDSLADAVILDHAYEIGSEFLGGNDIDIAVPFLLQAILALVPPGYQAPETSYESLEYAFLKNMQKILDAIKGSNPDGIMDHFQTCSQPNLMIGMAAQIMEMCIKGPKGARLKIEAQPAVLALVQSVIEELDRVLRLG